MSSAGEVVVTGVRKSFGPHEVLRGVDLVVPAGSLTAILGPSGSGKTTLLRIVAGFESPDDGSVVVGGRTFDDRSHHLRAEERGVGYVSQDGSLFPHLTIEANVGFGLSRAARKGRRPRELLAAVGLEDRARRYPHELSGGQQQRVALARALAVSPGLVLLDEPFSSLDENLRESLRTDVRSVLAAAGTTALLVTHDQDEALSIADHIAVLRAGVVAQVGTPRELYSRPVDAELARMIGTANVLAGELRDGEVVTALGVLPVRAAGGRRGTCLVVVRPEQIAVAPEGAGPGVRGRVTSTQFHGHDSVVRIDADVHGIETGLVARVLGDPSLTEGTTVVLTASGEAEVLADSSSPG